MKIVIAGAGEVGSHLAKMLSNEEQDIIIIDHDERRLFALDNYNLLTVVGSATSFETLRSVGVGNADIFIAVTPYESQNILACAQAKSLGARKTVARIDNDEFMSKKFREFFNKQGVDHMIYPEYLAALEMMKALERTWVRSWFELMDGELIVVGVKLRSNASLVGRRLKELGDMSSFMHVSAIKRNRETIIPGGDDLIEENDIVYIATTREHIEDVRKICGKKAIGVEKVIVIGGGDITVQLAKAVKDKYRLKIVENDLQRCQWLADMLPDANIVHGEPSDADILEEEGINDYDVFVALTDRSEVNILSCMMAKEHGVRKSIADVENIQFIPEAETLNIGTIINKKLLASSSIFQLMLDLDETDVRCLALADAEVAELIIKEGSKVTRDSVRNLNLSRSMTIAGLVREGKGYLVTGDTVLQAGDHVVVFCLSGAVHKIEKTFR